MGICTHDFEINCVFDQINCVVKRIRTLSVAMRLCKKERTNCLFLLPLSYNIRTHHVFFISNLVQNTWSTFT